MKKNLGKTKNILDKRGCWLLNYNVEYRFAGLEGNRKKFDFAYTQMRVPIVVYMEE
jgi:hypothetical protein